MLLVVMAGAPSSVLAPTVVVRPRAPSSFLFLVVRMLLVVMPGAPSSVLAPSTPSSFLFLVVRMLLVVMAGAPSSVLAPSKGQEPLGPLVVSCS